MKSNPWLLGVISLITLSVASCNKQMIGSGRLITEYRPTAGFAGIENDGDFKVVVTKGASTSVRLYGEDNILPEVITEVHNNRMIIRYRSHNLSHRHEQVVVTVTIPELNYVDQGGSGSVTSASIWSIPDLFTNISGSGNVDVSAKTGTVTSNISGSGQLLLHGEADKADFTVSGSGKVRAFELVTKQTNANISGSGTTQVTVSAKLNAHISGSGTVHYKGNPDVRSSISGSGKVVKH